jgi:hypothetical protein
MANFIITLVHRYGGKIIFVDILKTFVLTAKYLSLVKMMRLSIERMLTEKNKIKPSLQYYQVCRFGLSLGILYFFMFERIFVKRYC